MSTESSRTNSRSWWHGEAREMKARGEPMAAIARKFGKNYQTVVSTTRGVDYPIGKRVRPTQGYISHSAFVSGSRAQLAVRFPTTVMSRLNLIAKMEDKSLSSLVVSLVEEALSDESVFRCHPQEYSEYTRLMGDERKGE